MKAVRIHEHGGVDKLTVDDIPQPECPPDKIKIQIKAAALNHLDIWVRKGFPGITLPLPLILGSDGAGSIVEIGSKIKKWHVGEDVVIQPGYACGKCNYCNHGNENYCLQYGILGETENGVQAEFVCVDPLHVHSKAEHLTFEEAASMQLVFMTAYQMLIKRAQLLPNETVLVYGGTSGVGSAAIQISREVGATVIASVGSDKKFEHAQKMGANHIVNHSTENWSKDVREIAGKEGVNVIFEHIGNATWKQSLRLLSKGGRIVTCGATTGPEVAINLAHLFIKQQSIMGSTMSSIPVFYSVMQKIQKKCYVPFVDKTFLIKEVREAHKYVEARQHLGKVVLVN